MKKSLITTAAVLAIITGAWTYSRATRSYHFGIWKTSADNTDSLMWIPFTWMGDSIGNRYFDKLAMFVPVSLPNVPGQLQCQFDNGSNISMLYENPVNSIAEHVPAIRSLFRQQVSGKDTVQYIKHLSLKIGNVLFESPEVNIYRNYGEPIPADSISTGNHKIGTIGVDICKDRILIIDYPHTRLCVTKQLGKQYNINWTPISLDEHGRVVLQLTHKNKPYKVLFDCGSSMFPLLASHRFMQALSDAPASDTVSVSSWGTMLQLIGRPIADTFRMTSLSLSDIKVYTNAGREEIVPDGFDAVTGNVLFANKVVVIDFKNKRFGIVN